MKHWKINHKTRNINVRTEAAQIVADVCLKGKPWETDTKAVRQAWKELSDTGIIPSVEKYLEDLEAQVNGKYTKVNIVRNGIIVDSFKVNLDTLSENQREGLACCLCGREGVSMVPVPLEIEESTMLFRCEQGCRL